MKRLLKTALFIAAVLVIGLIAREYLLGVTVVAGDSMNDTLVTGDAVLLTRFDYLTDTPERGHVVQLEVPGRDGLYLKRVIGLPGETVEIKGGTVYIDGMPLNEPYAVPSAEDFRITLYDDEYFVLGDNRPVSYDSREEEFGVVNASCFRGRVRAVIWPVDRIRFGIE